MVNNENQVNLIRTKGYFVFGVKSLKKGLWMETMNFHDYYASFLNKT